MAGPAVQSWGRYPRTTCEALPVAWADGWRIPSGKPVLAHGLGRSYGDACLNDGGLVLLTRGLSRLVHLDEERAVLACEAGVSIGEILSVIVPRGFFLPVVPGTTHVTVGGAIANDVHGKNHHRCGTFGAQVESLELLRSDGRRLECAPDRNPELFAATVGGLGLTGVILRASLRLRRIRASALEAETFAIRDLGHFFDLSAGSDERFEYTVAWIDCLASGARTGRGIMHCGNHAAEPGPLTAPRRSARARIPFDLPITPVNRVTVSALNALYQRRHRAAAGRRRVDPGAFFFPLDAVSGWNRLYGRAGFFQLQSCVPPQAGVEVTRTMLGAVARSGQGSLAVLKNFGGARSPGLLSFPREGTTLAVDFPNRGEPTRRLLRELHAIVADAGGRIYAAKDALMPPEQFRAQHGEVLDAFRGAMDPAFSSSLWRRVTG